MKSTGELDPGVLSTFRRFIGLQLAITALGIAHWLVVPFPLQAPVTTLVVFSILEPVLLLLYLSLPGLQGAFKSWYLPLGIAGAMVGPILDPYLNFYATGSVAGPILIPFINLHGTGSDAPEVFAQIVLWRQIVLLLIPLVIVSWQYSIHKVVLFCGVTAVMNLTLLSQTVTFQEMISSSLLGIIAAQLVIYLLIGHMLVDMMKTQRAQRQHLTEANTRLAQYTATLEQLTVSRERNRLARELHDILAHTLSGVAVELEGVRSMLHLDLERASTLLNHSLQDIRAGLTETRRALKDLRAKPLEDLGLALAVQALAESYANQYDFYIDLSIEHDFNDTPVDVQQCVYRITQEALANVADHAQAQNVQVVLNRERDGLRLILCDDGCGFEPAIPGEERHYGLLGMRERAEMIGGNLSIESQVGQGTQVTFLYGGRR
ncbi:MAG: sensor histidine kinase [Anaerolineaceae bacterium]|nr:sensor histidine kinase [Anaerolineaceae bacterium]